MQSSHLRWTWPWQRSSARRRWRRGRTPRCSQSARWNAAKGKVGGIISTIQMQGHRSCLYGLPISISTESNMCSEPCQPEPDSTWPYQPPSSREQMHPQGLIVAQLFIEDTLMQARPDWFRAQGLMQASILLEAV